jgi:hypothetical protein
MRERAPAAFAAALAAEHAAVFGYGVVGAKGDKAVRDAARVAEAAHRTRRDALIVRFANDGATAPPAEPAYALPFPVTDRASALRLAVHLEDRTALAWRNVLPNTDGDERKVALDAYMDCAVRAVRWRRQAGMQPATIPFPGAPEN